LGVQVAQLVCAFLILLALGEKQDILTYLFVFLVSSVVAVIPFTVGGIGARELTFLYAARLLHLDIAVSVSLSLLFFVVTALVSLGGIYYSIRPEMIMSNIPRPPGGVGMQNLASPQGKIRQEPDSIEQLRQEP
jgi:hypothetical protein